MTDAPARAPEEWPLVSVIMPTRGRPELVRESIAAVVAQNYPGQIECLVVHDQEVPDTGLTRLGTLPPGTDVGANPPAGGERSFADIIRRLASPR